MGLLVRREARNFGFSSTVMALNAGTHHEQTNSDVFKTDIKGGFSGRPGEDRHNCHMLCVGEEHIVSLPSNEQFGFTFKS